jgi:hypothetical protein
MNAIGREAIRQQSETFEQLKRQDQQWFSLRLTMGYSAVVLLLVVLSVCAVVIFAAGRFPEFVVKAASVTLFADVIGLLLSVWKVALNPTFQNRLRPVTYFGDEQGTNMSRHGTTASRTTMPESGE